MDWSKAKTILIVALIITNSILGFSLYFSGDSKGGATTESEFIAKVTDLLEDKEITISADIPTDTPSILGITVEFEILDDNTLNNLFFGGRGSIDKKSDVITDISYGEEVLSIINKQLTYVSNSKEKIYSNISEEQAIEIADSFLLDKGFSTDDMKLSYIRKRDEVYNLEYTKIFDGNYIEKTFTIITVDFTGVSRLERTWMNMIEMGMTPIEISSAPEALLSLVGKTEVYNKTITDISLCYYFDPARHYLDDPGEAQRGGTIPAWRIQFEDGEKIFIDNY